MSDERVENIQRQFDAHGEAYIALPTVSEEKQLAGIVRISRVTPEERVLDVACGPGFIAMAFSGACREVVGIDVTDRFLSFARAESEKRGLGNVTFEYGDVESMPFEDGAFDCAVCRSAFHHFPNPAKVLWEMKRVVKPFGRLLIMDMIASEDAGKAAYHHRIETLCDPTHAKALSPSEFKGLFDDAGLAVAWEREGQVEYPVEKWLEHGGPAPEVAAEIRGLLEASVEEDRAGIPVWRDGDTLMIGHRAMSFLLNVPE